MRKPLVHVLFWVGFFFIWNRIVYFYIDNPVNRLYFTALDISLIITSFYIVFGFLMPRYFKKKRIVLFGILVAVLVITLSASHFFIMLFLLRHSAMPIHFNFSWTYTDMQYNRFFIALLGTLGGCITKLAIDWVQSSKRIERMEKEKSVAELIYLKSQINPHFLFNSLNSLYAQLEAGSADTKDTLSALAELLRFQLYECNADSIPVYKEIEYLKNYFTLQSIRKENCLVEFLCDDLPGNLTIAPLLLMPFVENAFKYVSDNDDKPNFIKAGLNFNNGILQFYCHNTLLPNKQEDKSPNNGIGLNNVVKRLELIYGEKYKLINGIERDIYNVDLEIWLI